MPYITSHNERSAAKDVFDEMKRQDEKWGADRNLPIELWNAIIGEERGEFEKEIVEVAFVTDQAERIKRIALARTELVQMAAVAVQAVEYLDRLLYGTHERRDVPHVLQENTFATSSGDCEDCNGSGKLSEPDGLHDCPNCNGTGNK